MNILRLRLLPDEEKGRRLLGVLEACRWLHNHFAENLDGKANYRKLYAQLRELREERPELREVNPLFFQSVLSRVVREARNGGVKPVEEYRSFSFSLGTGYLKILKTRGRFHLLLPGLSIPLAEDPMGLGLDLRRERGNFFTTRRVKRVEIGREGDGWWLNLWLRGESPNPETPDPPNTCSG